MSEQENPPLVSVLMPVRGGRDCLPVAVASVLAQTMAEWELLVVHDDAGEGLEWLDALRDPRVRLLANRYEAGRGGARQTALEASTGTYIAYLDADDWMYPQRLQAQVSTMAQEPDLALVSAGMVVVDEQEKPVGARRIAETRSSMRERPYDAPVLSASSMLRGARARRLGYDTRLACGEDSDFLVRYLAGQRFRQDGNILYCYREFASFGWTGLRDALIAQKDRRVRIDQRAALAWQRWLRHGWAWAALLAKLSVYRAALALGGKRLLLRRRCRSLSEGEAAAFETARQSVEHARRALPARAL